jgi:cellulose synthase/poly-beta-1,6-N-acetylglucosamine synthase-like glycosyltransferase
MPVSIVHIITLLLAFCVVLYAGASVFLWIGGLKRRPLAGADMPFVSVIVPARNEVNTIASCLKALAVQDYPHDRWELIVVDDRSEDGTGGIVAALIPMLPFPVTILRMNEVPPGRSPKKHGIATAIAQARGDVIMTTDADCRPEPRWLSSMIRALGDRDLVAGYAPYDQRGSLAGQLIAIEALSQGYQGLAGIRIGWPITCAGRSFGYRREVFEKAGGFGSANTMLSGDDNLFLQRAVSKGFRTAYCEERDSAVWTDPPETWREFSNQRTRMLSGARNLSMSVLALGIVVWSVLFLMLAGMIAGYWWAWAAFGVKFVADFVSMSIAATRFREWRVMWTFPIAELLYLPYYLYFGFRGTFGSYQWKGARGH